MSYNPPPNTGPFEPDLAGLPRWLRVAVAVRTAKRSVVSNAHSHKLPDAAIEAAWQAAAAGRPAEWESWSDLPGTLRKESLWQNRRNLAYGIGLITLHTSLADAEHAAVNAATSTLEPADGPYKWAELAVAYGLRSLTLRLLGQEGVADPSIEPRPYLVQDRGGEEYDRLGKRLARVEELLATASAVASGQLAENVPRASLLPRLMYLRDCDAARGIASAKALPDGTPVDPADLGALWADDLAKDWPGVPEATAWLKELMGEYAARSSLAWAFAQGVDGTPVGVRLTLHVADWGVVMSRLFFWRQLADSLKLQGELAADWRELINAHRRELLSPAPG